MDLRLQAVTMYQLTVFVELLSDTAATVEVTSYEDGWWMARQD